MGHYSTRDMYDCNGHWAAGRSYVYVIMARDVDGPMYVKVGLSDNPVDRICGVKTGCPIPIVKAGMVKCLSREQAKRVEKSLHEELAPYGSSGEWFRFDWATTEMRIRLQAALEGCFAVVRDWKFEEINLVAVGAFRRMQQAERQKKYRARKRKHDKVLSSVTA